MPPKNVQSKITVLKLKRSKTTYILMVDLTKKKTISMIKDPLSSIISQSGGLLLDDKNVDDDDIDEDDIEVPKSEFLDDDEVEAPKSEPIEQDQEGKRNVTAKELRVAIPKDKTTPYENQWIELTDDNIGDIDFNDYDVIAFALEDESFEIVEPAYEEN